MTEVQAQRAYTFTNLVQAKAKTAEQIGARLVMADQPECFSNSNAQGVVCDFSFDQVGARASLFGARCRQIFQAADTSDMA